MFFLCQSLFLQVTFFEDSAGLRGCLGTIGSGMCRWGRYRFGEVFWRFRLGVVLGCFFLRFFQQFWRWVSIFFYFKQGKRGLERVRYLFWVEQFVSGEVIFGVQVFLFFLFFSSGCFFVFIFIYVYIRIYFYDLVIIYNYVKLFLWQIKNN